MNPELHPVHRPYVGGWQVHNTGNFSPVSDATWVQYKIRGDRTTSPPMRADRIAWGTTPITHFRIVDPPRKGTTK